MRSPLGGLQPTLFYFLKSSMVKDGEKGDGGPPVFFFIWSKDKGGKGGWGCPRAPLTMTPLFFMFSVLTGNRTFNTCNLT